STLIATPRSRDGGRAKRRSTGSSGRGSSTERRGPTRRGGPARAERRATLRRVFHVELRQFPNVARSFNLSESELHARVVGPWVAERPLELDDRRWSPDKARLTIYEGPRLAPEEI